MQMDVYKTLYCFNTTEKMPDESTLYSHLFKNIFQVELCASFPKRCTSCHPLQLLLNWRINVVITVNSTQLKFEMVLNYQQLCVRFSH